MASKFHTVFGRKFLIVTNLLTALALILIVVKEGYPQRFFNKFISSGSGSSTKMTQEELAEMNKAFQPVFSDFSKGESNKVFKVLIIGNSFATHPVAENIGWEHESGMAASEPGKDYAHLLLAKISAKLPDEKIAIRVSNFAKFERNPDNLSQSIIDSLGNFRPDIVIFQLGENVKEQDLPLFKQKYTELINYFRKNDSTDIICTTPFYPSLKNNSVIDSISINTNSFVADLSGLTLLDEENFAKNEANYAGDKTKWKANGIGLHPGNKGMKNIAEQLFIPINAIISQRHKTIAPNPGK
jgi:hypothetical protein